MVNSLFTKKREKVTSKSGGAETQTDYILLRKDEEVRVKDCRFDKYVHCKIEPCRRILISNNSGLTLIYCPSILINVNI